MKKLLAAFLLAFSSATFAIYPGSPIAHGIKQSTNQNSSGNTTATSTVGADQIIVVITGIATKLPQTITEVGASNTWTKRISTNPASSSWQTEVWEATQPINTSAVHQFGTSSITGSFASIGFIADSGSKSSGALIQHQ